MGVELPAKHANSDDPRYPSPRQWRTILNRVLVQWACRTTLGKALVALCLIRDDTGGRPTLRSLIKAWLFGALMTVLTVVTG